MLYPNSAKLVGCGMGMGFAPAWLRQVSPPPLLHMTTLTTGQVLCGDLGLATFISS